MAWIHGPHYLEKPRMESAGMKKKKDKRGQRNFACIWETVETRNR